MIADQVYAHQVFGEKPFILMGVFGAIAIVSGWRFGWIAVTDPIGILHKTGV